MDAKIKPLPNPEARGWVRLGSYLYIKGEKTVEMVNRGVGRGPCGRAEK